MNQELIDERWYYVRTERDFLLSHCDWTQVTDSVLSEADTNAWRAYRRALRDITNQPDPFNIIWPSKPDD